MVLLVVFFLLAGFQCFVVGLDVFIVFFGVFYLLLNISFEVDEEWFFVDCVELVFDLMCCVQYGCVGMDDC